MYGHNVRQEIVNWGETKKGFGGRMVISYVKADV